MKKSFAMFAILSSTHAWGNSLPIEPLLVPVADPSQNINIQMGKYEVTVEEFTRFVNATGHQVKEKCHLYNEKHLPEKPHGSWNNPDLIKEPYRPVVCISTKDAMAYADWLADTTGKPYRLPEFNEWYFAASAGKPGRFAFGEDLNHSAICDYENIEDAANNAGLKQHHNYRYRYSANCNDGAIYHTVVGMYRPNNFGLHDMMGNVRELLQTCSSTGNEQATDCQSHVVAGSAWHWIPRPAHIKDSAMFVGSIEGFRLVLNSSKTSAMSEQSKRFADGLVKAQQRANIEHQRLKSLPEKPRGIRADLTKNNRVNLSWSASPGDGVTYALYRSYLDTNGKLNRKMAKVADGITTTSYQDLLPGKGAASYLVFANNKIGESQPGDEVFVGKPPVFNTGERIQAEFYHRYRYTRVIQNDKQQSVFFSANEGHYPPEYMPFAPAWLTYDFASKHSGPATLKMNIRGAKGAKLEFWQGNHLVAQTELEGSKDFIEKEVTAELKGGNTPIQVRAANQDYFVLDWFELHYQ